MDRRLSPHPFLSVGCISFLWTSFLRKRSPLSGIPAPPGVQSRALLSLPDRSTIHLATFSSGPEIKAPRKSYAFNCFFCDVSSLPFLSRSSDLILRGPLMKGPPFPYSSEEDGPHRVLGVFRILTFFPFVVVLSISTHSFSFHPSEFFQS